MADQRYFDEQGNYLDGPHYAKDCPVGKVQVSFVGVSPELRYSPYGWKPSNHAFMEIAVDEHVIRIDIGTFESSEGLRRGLHIITDIDVRVDKHSMNALDVYFDKPTRAKKGQ